MFASLALLVDSYPKSWIPNDNLKSENCDFDSQELNGITLT